MELGSSWSDLRDPGHQFQGALYVDGGDAARVIQNGFFQGSLRQVVEEARQAVTSLEEQLQSDWLERIGVDAHLLGAELERSPPARRGTRAGDADRSSDAPEAGH